jgi:BirA family transcriptional regulator, biotin operon repressor / biotin---[acetyl-CoA-carboxylase] ligase
MNARLIIYPEVESTQDAARELVLAGEPEGTAVMALKQTRGRGRSGHSWVSPSGKNLALSLILRPAIPPADAALLGLLASIAVAETVEAMGVKLATLKWPNDVWVHEKKIAGILPEANLTAKSVDFVIIGVGLNVNTDTDDFPVELRESVTSVFLETGRRSGLEYAARLLLESMGLLYARVSEEGCGFVPRLWQTRWAHEGAKVMVQDAEGIAIGIAPDGAMIIETQDGKLTRVTSGEALPVKPVPPFAGRRA